MESPMLKMVKSKNPEKDYPSNMGQRWTDEEDILLLEEISKNIDIEIIAQNHNRTTGGIISRCKDNAYKMYIKNIPMEEIILKTNLDETQVLDIINKKQNNNKKNTENKEFILMKNDINEMKNDIKELKKNINELVEMLKAIYDFEDN